MSDVEKPWIVLYENSEGVDSAAAMLGTGGAWFETKEATESFVRRLIAKNVRAVGSPQMPELAD